MARKTENTPVGNHNSLNYDVGKADREASCTVSVISEPEVR